MGSRSSSRRRQSKQEQQRRQDARARGPPRAAGSDWVCDARCEAARGGLRTEPARSEASCQAACQGACQGKGAEGGQAVCTGAGLTLRSRYSCRSVRRTAAVGRAPT